MHYEVINKRQQRRLPARPLPPSTSSRSLPIGYCIYGISFIQIDSEGQRALNLYLDYLQRDQHLNRLDEAWRSLKGPRTN